MSHPSSYLSLVPPPSWSPGHGKPAHCPGQIKPFTLTNSEMLRALPWWVRRRERFIGRRGITGIKEGKERGKRGGELVRRREGKGRVLEGDKGVLGNIPGKGKGAEGEGVCSWEEPDSKEEEVTGSKPGGSSGCIIGLHLFHHL